MQIGRTAKQSDLLCPQITRGQGMEMRTGRHGNNAIKVNVDRVVP